MWRITALSIGAVLALISAAHATSCREQIATLALQYNLAADLPRAKPPAGATETPITEESRGVAASDTLSRSGGVLVPPQEGRSVVIDPPSTGPGSTPTLPQVRPHTSGQPSISTTELSGARRAQMEAKLQAARAADAQGNETECLRHLGEAKTIGDSR
jgi:hypothetical protein